MEVQSRLVKAWKKCCSLKHLLYNQRVDLNSRLRLFTSTVTATLMFGSVAWTRTSELTRQLQTEQWKMLRRAECLQRATRESEAATQEAGLPREAELHVKKVW